MSWGSYARAAAALVEELRAGLTREDIALVHADLAALGLDAWLKWMFDNDHAVFSYLHATPAERKRKHKSHGSQQQTRMVMTAALLRAVEGTALLRGMSDNSLVPGWSNRATLVAASKAAQFVYEKDPWWPFEPPHPWT